MDASISTPTSAPTTQRIHNPQDPDPALALLLDQSAPVAPVAAQAMIENLHSRSRRIVLPVARFGSRMLVRMLGIIKLLIPRRGTSSKWLHRSIHWGLRTFVRPSANLLIMRHFHLGSQILGFIADNAGVEITRRPLLPMQLEDLEDNLFIQHDINLFNFIIELNQALQSNGQPLPSNIAPQDLNFDSITQAIEIEDLPEQWANVLDLETAIHLYTPIYQWFLSDRDFSRAVASLQLDETIGIYISQLLGSADHLHLINNRHPLVASRRVDAAADLMLHGLGTERLHHLLVMLRDQQTEAYSH